MHDPTCLLTYLPPSPPPSLPPSLPTTTSYDYCNYYKCYSIYYYYYHEDLVVASHMALRCTFLVTLNTTYLLLEVDYL